MGKGRTYNNVTRRTTLNPRLIERKIPKWTNSLQRSRKPNRPALTSSFPANNYHLR